MGFRLYINNNIINKFYGYVQCIEQLKSYKFLINKKYIIEYGEKGESIFNWLPNVGPFAMNYKDFKSFIKLYNKDLRHVGWQEKNEFIEREDIQKELKTKEDKILEWC